MGLVGVFEPRQADEIRKILNEASGAQVSVAPPKLIGSHGRYFVEANGFLRYPIERGKIATEQSRGSAVKPETERMNFRLEVKPDAVVDDELNLDIAAVLTTSTAVGEDAGVESAPGIASTHWKFSEDNPPEAARTIWTSVAIWNAQTVLFVRATEARQDHLQILLITVRAPGANGKTPPAENAKPQQWPSASPVPGKPGFVTSPYKPDAGFIDVRGFPKGTEVKDPYTGRMFLVP